MNWFRLKTCIKCQGDLAADDGDWICLQCGTYYYTGLYQLHSRTDDPPQALGPGVPKQPEKKLLGAVAAPLVSATTSDAQTIGVPQTPTTAAMTAPMVPVTER